MTDKELADRVDARKRLESHGYRRKPCPTCDGRCFIGSAEQHNLFPCPRCDGKGYMWEAPIT